MKKLTKVHIYTIEMQEDKITELTKENKTLWIANLQKDKRIESLNKEIGRLRKIENGLSLVNT